MPRTARASVADMCYHVINRGNAQAAVFHKDGDYEAFLALVARANERLTMRVLAYCLMPNHFHIVLQPRGDGDLGRWTQWLLTSHVRRYHSHYGTNGHVWQGRFRAFPIQQDNHLLAVLRYVEQNALRAGMVTHAASWKWSSAGGLRPDILSQWPVERPQDWHDILNEVHDHSEMDGIRQSVNRGTPYGEPSWARDTAARLGIEASLNPRGRPVRNR